MMDRRSERRVGWTGLTRRALLEYGALGLGALVLPPRARAAHHEKPGFELDAPVRAALDASPYVYISPLHPDGSESRCHGEVWYAHDRGNVLIATSPDAWKARAVRSGRDTARIWVGDYGRVRFGNNRFRRGPSFVARASAGRDDAAFERMLASFATKYPKEWGSWEQRFRDGYADGSRVLIRYTPLRAS